MLQSIKKPTLPDAFRLLVAGAVLWICCASCNTRVEGCLDINAENFDLNGERPCSGCCTYPSIGLSLSQKWADRNFSNEDTLYDSQSHAYKIEDLKYFLTSWSWTDTEGTPFTIDSVDATCDEDVLRYTPDIMVIDTRQFVYTFGTMRKAPHAITLHSIMGLAEDFSCLDASDPATPVNLTDNSPLWNSQTGSLETIRLIVQRNLEETKLDTVFIQHQLLFDLGYDLQMANGKDTLFNLTVNYQQWFKDVDVDDLSSFASSIPSNIPGSIIHTP